MVELSPEIASAMDEAQRIENYRQMISSDIEKGEHKIFDEIVSELTKRGGMDTDIFTLASSELVMVDIGVNESSYHRLELQKQTKDTEPGNMLSIWKVNKDESVPGDMFHYTEYFNNSRNKMEAVIDRSTPRSIDGHNADTDPLDFASILGSAIEHLNDHNWKIALGNTNRPSGQI